jgi:hypothetical protein
MPEQRQIRVRAPEQIAVPPIPRTPAPATVANPQWEATPNNLSLSDVLNLSLENLNVVRVLNGFNATSTGRTIYDPAITNTNIDNARGIFDPNLVVNNNWQDNNRPLVIPDPGDPTQSLIVGRRS